MYVAFSLSFFIFNSDLRIYLVLVSDFRSVARQINNYEFKKIPSGPFLDYYYHGSFTRTGVRTMKPKSSPRKSPKPKKDRLNRSASDDTQNDVMIQASFSPIEIYNEEYSRILLFFEQFHSLLATRFPCRGLQR
jgi:hypothetical protein